MRLKKINCGYRKKSETQKKWKKKNERQGTIQTTFEGCQKCKNNNEN